VGINQTGGEGGGFTYLTGVSEKSFKSPTAIEYGQKQRDYFNRRDGR